MEDKEWQKSKCIGTWLHKFVILKINERGVHEICERCQQEEVFAVVNQQTDNLEYLSYHLRSALTPNHPLYYAEYPKNETK